MQDKDEQIKRISGQVSKIHNDLFEFDAKNLSRFNKANEYSNNLFLEVKELKEEVQSKAIDEKRGIFRVCVILLLLFIAFKLL
jgi:hypothetical protein